MTPQPLTAPNTMGTTGTETPVQRQSEGESGPRESERASPDMPDWLFIPAFVLAVVALVVIEGALRVPLEIFIAGLGEERVAVANLCYLGYCFAIFILSIICMFIATGLVLFLWMAITCA